MRTSKRGQRRQVLSEDEYTSTLSSIVQRDFFPDLPALEKQAAVLDRREAKDFKGAVAVRRAARRLVEHEESLKEQEEHDEHDLDPHYSVRKTARPLHRESVSGFHARVTSEDNQVSS
jgi:protein DGCR14